MRNTSRAPKLHRSISLCGRAQRIPLLSWKCSTIWKTSIKSCSKVWMRKNHWKIIILIDYSLWKTDVQCMVKNFFEDEKFYVGSTHDRWSGWMSVRCVRKEQNSTRALSDTIFSCLAERTARESFLNARSIVRRQIRGPQLLPFPFRCTIRPD